ncbi:MAG TPA: TadE/TadG family type IV pilus assembly protein [Acidimicrobiales bacterium]|nr:TadE/TadG family type IV pilus assembly protein [Acidimicrobiales bacterium]
MRRPVRDERGGGPLSAWFGFVVFLALLLFAVQVSFNLYATSVVTSVAYDAARKVAGAHGGPGAEAQAEADARRALGRYGNRVTFQWTATGEVVELRVRATSPSVLLPALGGPLAFGDIDRTVRVRTERFR